MQAPKVFLSQIVRTSLKICQRQLIVQQQQPQQSLTQRLWQQHLVQRRATATFAAASASTSQLVLQQPIHTNVLTTPQRQHHSMSAKHHFLLPSPLQPHSKLCTSATLLKHPIEVAPPPLCEERARELVFSLKDSEREAIKLALSKYDALMMKQGFEGTLAATRWRSRFGPPKKKVLGEVDPTGAFCPFPDDWLKLKLAATAKAPSKKDLTIIFFVNAVPFIAFGFLDNFVMIVAGDRIESVLGSFMCLSTMAAAGLGNTVSDVLGIGSAHYVERGCEIMGLRLPDLTPVQMELKSSRRSANWGRIIGITIGCLLGMAPLYFMKGTRKEADEAKM